MYYDVPKPRQRKPKPVPGDVDIRCDRCGKPHFGDCPKLTNIRYIGEGHSSMFTTFIDGPAAGQKLSLRRNPLLLRVTHDPVTNSTVGGVWDALDQPNDKLGRSEKVYLYRLTGPPGYVHVRAARGSGLGGSWCTGVYSVMLVQPDREILRDNEAFGRWCDKNRLELMPAWATALLNTPEGPEDHA